MNYSTLIWYYELVLLLAFDVGNDKSSVTNSLQVNFFK